MKRTGFKQALRQLWLLGGILAGASASAASPIGPGELMAALAGQPAPVLVDVREAAFYRQGSIVNAINVPAAFIGQHQLPPVASLVLFDDGLGRPVAREAAELLSGRVAGEVRWLRGGYAAWLDAAGTVTDGAGFHPERLPRVSYRQLQESDLSDAIVVDLRAASEAVAAPMAVAGGSAPADDLVRDFALAKGAAYTRDNPLQLIGRSTAPVGPMSVGPAEAAPAGVATVAPLLVLIDDDYRAAEEMARRLRAAGHHRLVILTGGAEILRHQGREGLLRQSGSSSVDLGAPQ